jgi:aryl-phospho-beta-D-glucosidase BglC (GH1 family)
MENFITGYPGHEHEMRRALLGVLGQEKYDYFFTREDARFQASLGLNCVRIPINHRHFMDDEKDVEIKESGFKLVDRVVEACTAEGIYTILDMHTFPGCQNQGWHSDSGINRALFWEQKDLQDRSVKMWVEIAKRYAGNAWVRSFAVLCSFMY